MDGVPRASQAQRPETTGAVRPRTTEARSLVRPVRASAEERNAAVRAALAPIAPGERPWAVKVAVVVAFLLGAVNFVLFLAGTKPHVGGQKPQLVEILIFSGLMLMCSIGMWRLRYWALLGFQTLLAIGVLGFCLALIKASSLLGAAVCIVVIGGGGFLFIKLVRVLSRVQLPAPPGR